MYVCMYVGWPSTAWDKKETIRALSARVSRWIGLNRGSSSIFKPVLTIPSHSRSPVSSFFSSILIPYNRVALCIVHHTRTTTGGRRITAPAVLSVPMPTPMKTGPRSLIWQNVVAFRIALLSATIVSLFLRRVIDLAGGKGD